MYQQLIQTLFIFLLVYLGASSSHLTRHRLKLLHPHIHQYEGLSTLPLSRGDEEFNEIANHINGFLNGREEFAQKLAELESEIQLHIDELVEFETEYSSTQSLGIQQIHQKWQRICNNTHQSSAESFRSHSGLIARMLDSLWDMADNFSLTSSEDQAIRLLSTQFVKTVPELTESLGQIRALSVQVASQHQISADKKLQLLYTLSRIEERVVGLDSHFPESSLASLKVFLLTIKTGTENQGLSQQNPDHLFKDATLVIDDLFTFINGGFIRIQDQIQRG